MRVYRRGKVYWCRVFGVRQTTRCTDYQAAVLYAQRLEREGADPRHAASNSASWGEAVTELKAELRRRGRTATTIKIADQKTGHATRLWGKDAALSGVTAELLLKYVDRRQVETASRLTIRDELAYIRQALGIAKRLGRYPHHWDDVSPKFIAEYIPRKRALTPLEVRAVMDSLPPEKAAHVAWIVATGSDVSEAARARRSDVDARAKLVWVRGTKTRHRVRRVPVTPLTAGLVAYALKHAPGDDPLFDPWPWIQGALRKLAVRLGLVHFSPKDLRRTHGTWLRDAGVAPHLIGRVLGHADSTMAERVYARGHDEAIGAAVQQSVQMGQRVPMAYRGSGAGMRKTAQSARTKKRKSA